MVVHTGHPLLRELTHEPREFKASPDCREKPTEKTKENEIPKHQSRQISHDSFQISRKVNFHYVQLHLGVPRNSDVLISSRFGLSAWVLYSHEPNRPPKNRCESTGGGRACDWWHLRVFPALLSVLGKPSCFWSFPFSKQCYEIVLCKRLLLFIKCCHFKVWLVIFSCKILWMLHFYILILPAEIIQEAVVGVSLPQCTFGWT